MSAHWAVKGLISWDIVFDVVNSSQADIARHKSALYTKNGRTEANQLNELNKIVVSRGLSSLPLSKSLPGVLMRGIKKVPFETAFDALHIQHRMRETRLGHTVYGNVSLHFYRKNCSNRRAERKI